jgi:solute carrier family 12 sodium/potassium/chloride transporter 2
MDHQTITSHYHTSDAVPNTLYYRDQDIDRGVPRPSLDALRLGQHIDKPTAPQNDQREEEQVDESAGEKKKWWQFRRKAGNNKKQRKLGWIQGVLIRCLLNIWGVMLFIRLSWVVGQAGIGYASLIILLSTVVTVVTTLSMSAICTNGEVKGGGAYYLISRSLGPEFGGAIGIIFSLANAVAVGLYVVGFAETVTALLMKHQPGAFIIDEANYIYLNENNYIRMFGFVTVILLLLIALIGLDWESKIQILLLIILLVALVDAVIGSVIPRSCEDDITLQGFTHYNLDTFKENFLPHFDPQQDFFSIFSVFFPAATGILAGANISGDLKDPQSAIPKGTLLAIVISSAVYLGVAWMLGFTVLILAPGSPDSYFSSFQNQFSCGDGNISVISSDSLLFYCSNSSFNLSSVANYTDSCYGCNVTCDYGSSPDNLRDICNANGDCQYGLLRYFQVMEMISGFGPIVTAGIFAATLSSALASLVSAPKVFQRVCQDNIFPFIGFFGKGGWKGTGSEPIRGYFLTFIIAVACIAIAELNVIALIISNFFLMAYTLINFSCFAASFSKTPGWRPAFKFYSHWVALVGSVLCLVIMFIISWWAALVTLIAVAALYLIVYWRKPDINWGSSTQAFLYTYSTRYLQKLEKLEDHVKNFRPQFLVLTGPPSSRPDMAYFISQIATDSGIMICGHVLLGDYTTNRRILLSTQQRKWLRSKKVSENCVISFGCNYYESWQSLFPLFVIFITF